MTLDVRPAGDRFVTRADGVQTRHCFSFGHHYDPAQVGHGRLVVCDEHRLDAGAGFAPHPHRDVEVVTWVLAGTLVHTHGDHEVRVPAGSVQRMSAGGGVVHAERADDTAVRFVQAWVVPVAPGGATSYEHREVEPELLQDALVPVVSGLGHQDTVGLGAPAALHVGRLSPGARIALPRADRLHLLVTAGVVDLDGRRLGAGDSARLTSVHPEVTGLVASEVLVWELPTSDQQE